jgi:hypothetical protein
VTKKPLKKTRSAAIAHGHQQVNNDEATSVARAEQVEKASTELLEYEQDEWLDTGAGQRQAEWLHWFMIHRD